MTTHPKQPNGPTLRDCPLRAPATVGAVALTIDSNGPWNVHAVRSPVPLRLRLLPAPPSLPMRFFSFFSARADNSVTVIAKARI